ncbi:MAG TPA: hypothetical protein VG267_06730 [Terracidiphilus sp.]|nr:hypothetical protein [Terracidiphilus sp.]
MAFCWVARSREPAGFAIVAGLRSSEVWGTPKSSRRFFAALRMTAIENPAAAKLFSIIARLQEQEGVRLRVVA